MLTRWNEALTYLAQHVAHPDAHLPLVPYGEDFLPAELGTIPPDDLPPGLPAWMREDQAWATRTGDDVATKRRTITVKVPDGVIP